MKCYIVIKNLGGATYFDVDPQKSITSELLRVLKENYIELDEGDKIEFISE